MYIIAAVSVCMVTELLLNQIQPHFMSSSGKLFKFTIP
jgi:hypothetical protein